MKTFVELSGNTYSYLKDNSDEDKKAKGTKKCVIKRNLKFSDSKKYLKASQIENRINCLENKKKLIWIVLKKIKKKLWKIN